MAAGAQDPHGEGSMGSVPSEGIRVGGLAIGVAGAIGFNRVMSTLVFGVDTLDPIAFVGASALLTIAAAAACAIPARRAARLDPVAALRQE